MNRFTRQFCAAVLTAGLLVCGDQKAYASNQTLSLVIQANKAFEDGDLATARNSVEQALKDGSDKEITARAMLLRGQIQEKEGKLARALSDYSGALWLQTLPANEKKKASDGKERVMAAMGLNSSPGPRTASPSTPGAAEPASESPGLFGSLGSMFGGGGRETNEPPKVEAQSASWQTATAQVSVEPASKGKPVVAASASAEDDNAKPRRPAKKVKERAETAASVRPAEPAPRVEKASTTSAADDADGYFIDFGAAGSANAAKDQAKAIKTKLSDILVNRDLIVRQGGGGYRIVAGPYKAKTAAAALCSAMSRRGVSCKVAGG